MLEIRFTQAVRKRRIGRASVRHVVATAIPAETVMPTSFRKENRDA